MGLKRVGASDEAEIQDILAKEPDAIEQGMTILKQYFVAGDVGKIDLLMMDSKRRIAVAELKVESDESAPVQLMRYLDYVWRHIHMIAHIFGTHSPDPESPPRPILIEKNIPASTLAIACYLEPQIELYTYQLFEVNGKKEVNLQPVPIPSLPEGPPEIPTISKLRDYLLPEELKVAFDQMIAEVKKSIPEAEIRATTTYLGIYFKNHMVGWIGRNRRCLWPGAYTFDSEGNRANLQVPVETGSEPYENVIEAIRAHIEKLKQS